MASQDRKVKPPFWSWNIDECSRPDLVSGLVLIVAPFDGMPGCVEFAPQRDFLLTNDTASFARGNSRYGAWARNTGQANGRYLTRSSPVLVPRGSEPRTIVGVTQVYDGTGMIFNQGTNTARRRWSVSLETGFLRLAINASNYTSSVPLPADTTPDAELAVWATTLSGADITTCKMYCNGAIEDYGGAAGTVNTSPAHGPGMGQTVDDQAQPNNLGRHYALYIWSRALEKTELDEIWKDPFGLLHRKDEAGVVYPVAAAGGDGTDMPWPTMQQPQRRQIKIATY